MHARNRRPPICQGAHLYGMPRQWCVGASSAGMIIMKSSATLCWPRLTSRQITRRSDDEDHFRVDYQPGRSAEVGSESAVEGAALLHCDHRSRWKRNVNSGAHDRVVPARCTGLNRDIQLSESGANEGFLNAREEPGNPAANH